MKHKKEKNGDVVVFRDDDQVLGLILKVEITSKMYAYEFKQYPETTMTCDEMQEVSVLMKKLQ